MKISLKLEMKEEKKKKKSTTNRTPENYPQKTTKTLLSLTVHPPALLLNLRRLDELLLLSTSGASFVGEKGGR